MSQPSFYRETTERLREANCVTQGHTANRQGLGSTQDHLPCSPMPGSFHTHPISARYVVTRCATSGQSPSLYRHQGTFQNIPEPPPHWHFLNFWVVPISSSRLFGGRGKVRSHPSPREEGHGSVGCRSLMPTGRAAAASVWPHPLGTSPAPETGASSLESDFILDICTADSQCQSGPMAWPGDVTSQPDSLPRWPSPPAAVQGPSSTTTHAGAARLPSCSPKSDPRTLREPGRPLPLSPDRDPASSPPCSGKTLPFLSRA